ncbi:MAG TPA: polysaccharide biosynthesis tyrosine autokinase [Allosphingosinicella sp.]|jgi:capsular exopolysaccharide synthesis family protein
MRPTFSLRADQGGAVPIEPTPLEGPAESFADGGGGGGGGLHLDFRRIWAGLYRNRWLVGGILVAAIILGVIATALTVPLYRATTRVEIERQSANVLNVEDVEQEETSQDVGQFLQTQVQILRSRSLREAVADDLGLIRDNSFLEKMNGPLPDEALRPEQQRGARRDFVLDVLEDNLNVVLLPSSRIVELSFSSPDKTLSSRVANSFAKKYIEGNLSRRFETSSYARTFLNDQLGKAKERLEASERSLNAYARQAGLIDTGATGATTGGDSGTSLTTTSLTQFSTALNAARTQRIGAEQKWNEARGAPALSIAEVYRNPAVSALVQRRAQLRADYEEARQRRKEDFPEMRQMAAEVEQIDRELNSMASGIRNSIRRDYEIARAQETALEQRVAGLTSDRLGEQDRSVQFNILNREVQTNRVMYDGLLQRFKELSAAAGLAANNISVVDKAEPPRFPYKPQPVLNIALATFMGLVLGILAALARERLAGRLRVPEDIENNLGVPVLSTIPVVQKADLSETLKNPRSPASEAYHTLRTALELSTSTGVPKTLLFTSGQQGEGKSTSALTVATDFAKGGRKVLLVDADMRRPSLHRRLDRFNETGLSSILAAQAALPSAVQEIAGHPNLSFLSSGPLPPSPAELLSGPMLRSFLDQASAAYDLVILDGPPVLALADATILASKAAGTVMVIEADRSRVQQVRSSIERLRAGGARLIGAVFSKFDARHMGYEYDYRYNYEYRESEDGDGGGGGGEGVAGKARRFLGR